MKFSRWIILIGMVLAIGIVMWWRWPSTHSPKQTPSLPKTPVEAPALPPTLEWKQAGSHAVPFQNGLPYFTSDKQKRLTQSLNGPWVKKRIPAHHALSLSQRTPQVIQELQNESPDAFVSPLNGSIWQNHDVPGVENPAPDRYQDGVWYQRNVEIPITFSDRRILLHFGAVNYIADIWMDGKWIGYHEGGSTPFSLDATHFLTPGKISSLVVRVDNPPWRPHPDGGAIDKSNDYPIVPYKTADWWNYGGILRSVELEALPQDAILRAEIRSSIQNSVTKLETTVVTSGTNGKLRFKLHPARLSKDSLLNPFAEDLAAPDEIAPIETVPESPATKVEDFQVTTHEISYPALEPWTLRHPKLYVLEVELLSGEQVLDRHFVQFGVRTFDRKGTELLLNDKPVFLKGIAVHETFPHSFPEQTPDMTAAVGRDFQNIYDLNANFVRSGHRPPHPFTPMVADRLGIGLWEEIPVYWFEGNAFDYQRTTRPIARQMFGEMLARDINHPSILVWGTCNECESQDERKAFITDLKQLGESIDRNRLIAQSASGSDPLDETHNACDLFGFTSYYGVFYGHTYGAATVKALETMHASHPNLPLFATEFGIWSEKDLSNSPTQIRVARDTFQAFTCKPYMKGCIWWALNDWHTMISNPQSMGLVTLSGDRKPAFYALQDLYATHDDPMFLRWRAPARWKPLRGRVDLDLILQSSSPAREISIQVDGRDLEVTHHEATGHFTANFDSTQLMEGPHIMTVRAENQNGTVLSEVPTAFVDNVDEPPTLEANLHSGDFILDGQILCVNAQDDRDITRVEARMGEAPWKLLDRVQRTSTYLTHLSASAGPSKLQIRVVDDGNHTVEKTLDLHAPASSFIHLPLPFDCDWISSSTNLKDGTGWDFPTEELPAGGQTFVHNSQSGPIVFQFPDTSDGVKNCVECRGQTLNLPAGRFKAIHILAAMHDGSAPVRFLLHPAEGTMQVVTLNFSDWWRGEPAHGDERAILTTVHHEASDAAKAPGVGIYMQSIPLGSSIPTRLSLPNDSRLRIFAISLEPSTP